MTARWKHLPACAIYPGVDEGIDAMDGVALAEAEAHLSKLVSRAEAGETIDICRDGKAVVRLVPVEQPIKPSGKPFDWEALRRFTETLPFDPEPAGEFIRRMRDDARY